MNYIYIDESGSEGTNGRYIIFASILTSDPRALDKSIRKLWKSKPQFHHLGEFHAKEVDSSTRERLLVRLAELPITIRYTVLDKSKQELPISKAYYSVLAQFINVHSDNANIIIDKKDTNRRRSLIMRDLGIQHIFANVVFEESYRVKQLQAVDFVAWSLGRLYEHDDAKYYDLIKHKESPSL